jgi:regulatory protein
VPTTTRRSRSRDTRADPGPAPAREALHEAALAYLARGAATAAVVGRVLDRKVAAWARRAVRAGRDAEEVASDAARSREAIAPIVARFGEVGLVNDTSFATSRARSLAQAGRSRRAIQAHLTAKGVAAAIVREALPDDPSRELASALAFARKRRIGPFLRDEDAEELTKEERRKRSQKAIAAMARAGFGWSVAERVLAMDREQADARLFELRSL